MRRLLLITTLAAFALPATASAEAPYAYQKCNWQKPTNLTATNPHPGEVVLSWTEPTNGPYPIPIIMPANVWLWPERGQPNESKWTRWTPGVTGTSVKYEGLAKGTYEWFIYQEYGGLAEYQPQAGCFSFVGQPMVQVQ